MNDPLQVADSSPSASTSARKRHAATRSQPDIKLGSLLEAWKDNRKPAPKTLAAARKAVRDFTSYIGDIGIGEITANDCFEFRDALAKMPRRMPHAHRQLAFTDAQAIYAGLPDAPRVAPPSIKKYLGGIQALLSFAFQERFLPANPAAGIRVDGYHRSSSRRPFTKDELRQLFAADLFTRPWSACRSRSVVSDSTMRWLFLLGLFTGARIEELGQLLLADIQEELGTAFITVTDYAVADGEERKRVKTAKSVRVLPLHPQLIALGFPAYAERMRSTKAAKLFPDLLADSLGVKTKEASRRAGRLIDSQVGKGPRIVFHSLRHNFKDFCREANIPKEVHDQLTGHASADVGGSYGVGRAVADRPAYP
jgi:integrase